MEHKQEFLIVGKTDTEKAIFLLREIDAFLSFNISPPPAQMTKIRKTIQDFYFHFKQNLRYGQWFAHIQTPLFHFQKDNCNLVFGPSFLWWQFSLHFHW